MIDNIIYSILAKILILKKFTHWGLFFSNLEANVLNLVIDH